MTLGVELREGGGFEGLMRGVTCCVLGAQVFFFFVFFFVYEERIYQYSKR